MNNRIWFLFSVCTDRHLDSGWLCLQFISKFNYEWLNRKYRKNSWMIISGAIKIYDIIQFSSFDSRVFGLRQGFSLVPTVVRHSVPMYFFTINRKGVRYHRSNTVDLKIKNQSHWTDQPITIFSYYYILLLFIIHNYDPYGQIVMIILNHLPIFNHNNWNIKFIFT